MSVAGTLAAAAYLKNHWTRLARVGPSRDFVAVLHTDRHDISTYHLERIYLEPSRFAKLLRRVKHALTSRVGRSTPVAQTLWNRRFVKSHVTSP